MFCSYIYSDIVDLHNHINNLIFGRVLPKDLKRKRCIKYKASARNSNAKLLLCRAKGGYVGHVL